jgi:hypothetical protein
MPPIAITASGMPSTTPTQNRRDIWRSSLSSGGAPAVGTMGSRAMPQMGQAPGWSLMTSGSIGQVYFVPGTARAAGVAAFWGMPAPAPPN